MKMIICGEPYHEQELRVKFGSGHDYKRAHEAADVPAGDVIFFFAEAEKMGHWQEVNAPVFLDCSNRSLRQWNQLYKLPRHTFGFCGWPGFLNCPGIEVSLVDRGSEPTLTELGRQLNFQPLIVSDQAGLVSPRVIAMIINEAYLAAGEGIANRSDIDLAMKLGTGYPYGPFEWCSKIGAARVLQLLRVLNGENPHRYTISPLLQSEAGKL